MLFLWPRSSGNIRQVPIREALGFIWDWPHTGWEGGQKVPSHLAAVWTPRGQSSHLSSLIKATGICMTAPSPHLFLLKQKILTGSSAAAVAENGTWWYVYHKVNLSYHSVASDCPKLRPKPGLLCCTPQTSIFFHSYCLPERIFSVGLEKLLHLQLSPRLHTIWYWLLL